jgi:MFS family permease
MLLGGRAADMLGRRRVLVAGTSLFGLASIIGGLAGSSGVLIAARLAQGGGAAMHRDTDRGLARAPHRLPRQKAHPAGFPRPEDPGAPAGTACPFAGPRLRRQQPTPDTTDATDRRPLTRESAKPAVP